MKSAFVLFIVVSMISEDKAFALDFITWAMVFYLVVDHLLERAKRGDGGL